MGPSVSTRRRRFAAFVGILVPLLGGACTPAGAPLATEHESLGHEREGNDTQIIWPEWREGPLDEFMMRIWGRPITRDYREPTFVRLWADADFVTRTQLAEDNLEALRQGSIAACMHQEGFTYVPRPVDSFTIVERPAGTFIPGHSREWAERFGFGISTVNDPGRHHRRFEVQQHQDRAAWDRYWEQHTSVSDAEREAFELALWGPPGPGGSRTVWFDSPTREFAESRGCVAVALYEERGAREPLEFSGIANAVIVEFPRSIIADPRVQELEFHWASCMVWAGFPNWVTPQQAMDNISDLESQTQMPFDASLHLAWDWGRYPEGPPQDVPFVRQEFRAFEIAAATASWDCRDQLDYDTQLREIELDLQKQFVNTHWLALEDWARAVEN